MKSPHARSMARFALAICFLLVTVASSYANSIAVSLVGTDSPPTFHTGSAYDSSTGKYLSPELLLHGSVGLRQFGRFRGQHQFLHALIGRRRHSRDLFCRDGWQGVSRSDASTNSVSVWDASTGTELASTNITAMSGVNGSDTFNWGGFSGMNFIDDGNSLYLFGQSTGSGWIIDTMDSNLNVTSSLSYSPLSLGYAFVINGTLFSGSNYNIGTINRSMDIIDRRGIRSRFHLDWSGLRLPLSGEFRLCQRNGHPVYPQLQYWLYV